MMKTLVITKMAGQTGLLPVGSVIQKDSITSEYWIKSGWAVEKPVMVEKEEKHTFETKEYKLKRKTKNG